MNVITKILAITACSLPLVALAQTPPAVAPADKPSTDLQRKQTTDTGQATQYGAPGTDTGGSMSKPGGSMSKPGMKHDAMKSDKTKATPPVGDVPTYPAPTPDGKPTK